MCFILRQPLFCISFPICFTIKSKVDRTQLMSYILLVIGFTLLIKGADTFVSRAVSIANIFYVPSLVIN